MTLNMQVFIYLSLFTGTIACDHYPRECKFGILKKKTKQNKKMRTPSPFSRRSFQFEQLLIGYQSKFNNLLSISSLASISLSFSIYCQTLFRILSAGVLCTLRVAGWKPTSNHIEITVGFFNLHKRWLSLHRGHPVNVPIRRMMYLSGRGKIFIYRYTINL